MISPRPPSDQRLDALERGPEIAFLVVCNKHDGELHGGEDSIRAVVLRSSFGDHI